MLFVDSAVSRLPGNHTQCTHRGGLPIASDTKRVRKTVQIIVYIYIVSSDLIIEVLSLSNCRFDPLHGMRKVKAVNEFSSMGNLLTLLIRAKIMPS